MRRTAVKGSHILMLTQLARPLNPILHSQAFSEVLSLVLPTELEPEDDIGISDCQNAVVTKLNALSHSKRHISIHRVLSQQYINNAVVGLFEKTIIYLRKIKGGRALYVSDGKRSEDLDNDVIDFKVTKQEQIDTSLLHVQIMRKNLPDIDFYASVLGR